MGSTSEDGFTLIETVIAMLVMTIAVVTIVGALTTMITFTSEHREHAVAETSTRSVGQIATAVVSGTTLTNAIGAGDTNGIQVADAARLLPQGSGAPTTANHTQTYVQVGDEIMRVDFRNVGANTINVERRIGWDPGLPETGHAAGSMVLPVLRCPTADQLEPAIAADALGDGVTFDVPADGVTYWKPGGTAGTFVDRSACLADYNLRCPPPEALAECGYGLVRARIEVSTPEDPRLNSRETALLLRQGSM